MINPRKGETLFFLNLLTVHLTVDMVWIFIKGIKLEHLRFTAGVCLNAYDDKDIIMGHGMEWMCS